MRYLNKDFGAAASEARRKPGLTQVGLAEELGKTDWSISDMENGKTTPKLDTAALFARRLGMSEEEAAGYIRLCEDKRHKNRRK